MRGDIMNLNFEPDEHIIIQSEGIFWISDQGQRLESLVLSNKGLYCAYKVKAGFFSKPEEFLYRFELSDILIENNISQIEVVKVENERCLQILFKHGAEHFSFQRVPKKTLDDWRDAFKEVLGVVDATTAQKEQNIERLSNLAEDVVEGVGTLIGTGSRMLFGTLDQMAENRRSTVSQTKSSRSTGNNDKPLYTYYEESAKETPPPKAKEPKEEPLYYIAIDGQQRGPYKYEEIRELANNAFINRSTLAWTKGMDNWQKLETIKELEKIVESMPPTLFND